MKWHGLRLLEDELGRLRRRQAPLRVITTTYMGATERAALDRLVRELGAEVRIQYDAARTRLHAKAWMFRRETRYDTAYVGSSNLSRAALLDGVEWNVRLSRVATPSLLEKFGATFDTYWNDASFELYDPDRDRDRLDDALAEASGGRQHDRVTISLSGLEVRPFAYQQQMLDELAVERDVHDRHRNLVVAATGTGKTVVAALDYRRLCGSTPAERPRLLFVAHRKEILEQSLRTYREVLADPTFGELYVAGARPERWDHVFASVQSLQSYGDREHPCRQLRHRGHRRVPPRAGSDVPATARASDARASCSASLRPLSAPTGSTSALSSSTDGRPPSCAVGCARQGPAVPVPLLRSRRRH